MNRVVALYILQKQSCDHQRDLKNGSQRGTANAHSQTLQSRENHSTNTKKDMASPKSNTQKPLSFAYDILLQTIIQHPRASQTKTYPHYRINR